MTPNWRLCCGLTESPMLADRYSATQAWRLRSSASRCMPGCQVRRLLSPSCGCWAACELSMPTQDGAVLFLGKSSSDAIFVQLVLEASASVHLNCSCSADGGAGVRADLRGILQRGLWPAAFPLHERNSGQLHQGQGERKHLPRSCRTSALVHTSLRQGPGHYSKALKLPDV